MASLRCTKTALLSDPSCRSKDLAIETIELLLQSKYDETENRLGRAQVLQLLKFCLRTYFTFDGTIYEQVKGTPMGSPISGFIAEAVLQRLESLVFQHHKPKFWARYVDDTFVVIDRDQLLTFKERLNAVFPDIQFTMEEEENNLLAFLDVLVCRKDCGGLKTKVFRKATNTTQVLNLNSNHPISHKRSCVRTLRRRVETHCSEPEDKIADLQYLRRVFQANGYFVDRCIRKRNKRPNHHDTKSWRALPDDLLKKELAYLYRLFRSNGYPASFVKNCLRHQAQPQGPTLNGEIVSRQFFSLPYMQGTSEVIARQLNRSGIHIAHKPASSLRAALSRIKHPLPKEQQTNVIYHIPCSNCSCVYVGHTGRSLGTRIKEQKLAVRRRDPLSLVFAHALEYDHRFNLDGTEVVAMANTKRAREFLEAWYSNAGSINRRVDLDAHYEGLRSRLTAPYPNHASTTANTEVRSPTDSPPTLPLQHSVPVVFPPPLPSPPHSVTYHDLGAPSPHTSVVCLSYHTNWSTVTT
ncbi:hypothetical protein SprV_0802582900 [Sparganum proliferum]